MQACILETESPSSLNDQCKRLHSSVPYVQNSTVHLFDGKNQYITTCYPAFDRSSKTPKGKLKNEDNLFYQNMLMFKLDYNIAVD